MDSVTRTFRLDPGVDALLSALAKHFQTTEAGVLERLVMAATEDLKRMKLGLPPELRDRVEGLRALQDLREWVREKVAEVKKRGAIPDTITQDLAALIDANDDGIKKQWMVARDSLGQRLTNQRFGRAVKEAAGLESFEQVRAAGPAANIITTYTKLRTA